MIYADDLRIIVALIALGQQFTLADDPKFGSPTYLSASLASAGADTFAGGMGVADRFGAKFGVETLRNTYATDSPTTPWYPDLIIWALSFAEVLELFTGFGPPYEGDDLKSGLAQITVASDQLGLAVPDTTHWQGSAAQSYADQNATLQDDAQTLADLDRQLAHHAKIHADWVTYVRLGFAALKNSLAALYLCDLWLMYDGEVAEAKDVAFLAVYYGILAAIAMIVTLAIRSSDAVAKIDDLTSQYQELSGTGDPFGTCAKAEVAAPTEPAISSSAGNGQPPLHTAIARADAAQDRAPAKHETSDLAMPTVAQLMALSGRATTPFGHGAFPPAGRTQSQQGQRAVPLAQATAERSAVANPSPELRNGVTFDASIRHRQKKCSEHPKPAVRINP